LPKYVTEKRIEEHFASKGQVTDVKLARTKDGTSRRFAFVGFQSEKEAAGAQKYFEGTFMDTSKLSVEFAFAIEDPSLPRPWSKYSQGSSAHDKWATDKHEKAKAKDNDASGQDKKTTEAAKAKGKKAPVAVSGEVNTIQHTQHTQ